MHLDAGSSQYEDKMWNEGIYSEQPCQGFGCAVDERLSVTQQCVLTALKASHVLGCIKRVACRASELILHLCSGEIQPSSSGILSTGERDMDLLE